MLLALLLLLPTNDTITVQARLGDGELGEDTTTELWIAYELAPGWTRPANPMLPGSEPAALLQLDLPAGIEVEGEVAQGFDALLRRAFLDLPHERLLEAGTNTIALRVHAPLSAGAALEFNVLTYAAPAGVAEEDPRPRLLRRRYRIALRPGASAERVPDGAATWGKRDVLALGETVPDFVLATPFGVPLTPENFIGKGLVVLTTYRSCL